MQSGIFCPQTKRWFTLPPLYNTAWAIGPHQGHWQGDTVVEKRDRQKAVGLFRLQKTAGNYLAIRIPGKSSETVMKAIWALRDEFGEHFADVFKTIAADNGSEFADFAHV
jgi:IS30 family transposase